MELESLSPEEGLGITAAARRRVWAVWGWDVGRVWLCEALVCQGGGGKASAEFRV